jgi:hypothetical protein
MFGLPTSPIFEPSFAVAEGELAVARCTPGEIIGLRLHGFTTNPASRSETQTSQTKGDAEYAQLQRTTRTDGRSDVIQDYSDTVHTFQLSMMTARVKLVRFAMCDLHITEVLGHGFSLSGAGLGL